MSRICSLPNRRASNLDFSYARGASGLRISRKFVVQQRFLRDPRCAPMQTEVYRQSCSSLKRLNGVQW